MKTISRYIMTLALLITAVGGAWADEATITLKCGTTEKTYENVTLPWSTTANILKEVVTDLNFNVNINTISGGDGKVVKYGNENFTVNGTFSGDATVTVTYNTGSSATITVTAPAPLIALDDTKTVATMAAMPTYDVTVEYSLVRDLTQRVTFGGIPTGDGLVVKNNGTAYEFVTAPTFTLTDALADNADIISADGITITVGKMVEVEGVEGHRQFDETTAVSLADFLANPQPGIYKIKATATADGPYDGTIYSAEFTTVEKYDLAIQPADEYSKGKIESVIVGSGSVTIDANTGEATKTGIDPETEVKVKAKRGYVIDKVEVKKTMKLLTLTVNGVTIYYAEGDSWANAISRDENKDSGLFIREGNRVHHTNYGQLVDSNTEAVLPGAIINANESYRFIK